MTNRVTTLVPSDSGSKILGRMSGGVNAASPTRRYPSVPVAPTFTAKYKLRDPGAPMTPPPMVRRVAVPSGGPVFQPYRGVAQGARCGCRWLGPRRFRADVAGATRKPSRSPRLEQEKRQLEQELDKTRFVVDVQAKLHALLETLSESAQPENGSMK